MSAQRIHPAPTHRPTGDAPRGRGRKAGAWRVTTLLTGGLLAGVVALSGCRAGPRDFENENDRLRRENLHLRRSVEQLEQRLELRLAELETLEQRLDRPTTTIEGARVPQAVSLRLDRYSGVIDTTNDGTPDTVRLYVRPVDRDGRFIPVAGRAVLQVVAIRAGHQPALLTERVIEPAEWDAAYRTGFTGTHYTIEAALTAELPEGLETVTVSLRLTDAASGATLTHEQSLPLRRR